MDGFDPATSFGADVASRYDDEVRGDEGATVDFLAALADRGRALEFAIGTGRIALPLTARGITVDGIELSESMVAKLREKQGGGDVDVVMGDMATTTTGRHDYSLVYLVFNTIYNLLTQQGQIDCFANASTHLAADGRFVVEAGTPWSWLRGTQFVNVEHLAADAVVLDVNRYDHATQILDESHVRLTDEGVRLSPIECRLIWPSEMDLMARIAGLELVDRWGGWRNEPFSSRSERHVSVYRRV